MLGLQSKNQDLKKPSKTLPHCFVVSLIWCSLNLYAFFLVKLPEGFRKGHEPRTSVAQPNTLEFCTRSTDKIERYADLHQGSPKFGWFQMETPVKTDLGVPPFQATARYTCWVYLNSPSFLLFHTCLSMFSSISSRTSEVVWSTYIPI